MGNNCIFLNKYDILWLSASRGAVVEKSAMEHIETKRNLGCAWFALECLLFLRM